MNIFSVEHSFKLLPAHVRQERTESWERTMRKGKTFKGKFNPLSRGAGIFIIPARRNQRCIIKASYTKNTKTRSWAAHGEYLQRERAQHEKGKGLGFDAHSNSIDLKLTLREWQNSNDEHVFRLILSPENGHQMNLKRHTQDLITQMEKDLKTKLQWAAIDHHNTDHSHVHLLVRGRDDKGKTLVIEPDYLSRVMRLRSEDLATRELGLRHESDLIRTRTKQIDREYLTEIDRNLLKKSEQDIINYHTAVPNNLLAREHRLIEIKRLKFLETIGLAERFTKKSWKLHNELKPKLLQMKLTNDIIKSRANHNMDTFTNEILVPTQIKEHRPLTGKVIGMGLEDELKDRRYLLLEGIDGKVHYIQATNSIIKARDNALLHNGNIITLENKKFTNAQQKEIEFIQVKNHFNLKELQLDPHSRLDRDVVTFVHAHKRQPSMLFPTNTFANEYAMAMQKRFDELEKEKIILKNNDQYELAANWQKKLEQVITKRKRDIQLEFEKKYIEHKKEKSLDILIGR